MYEQQHYTEKEPWAITQDDKYEKNCDLLREFIVLRGRFPQQCKDTTTPEHKIAMFRSQQRTLHRSNGLRPDRKQMLDAIHPAILDDGFGFDYIVKPSAAWKQQFDIWANDTTEAEVRSFKFPTIPDPYVATARSYQEHIVIKMGWHNSFEPSECHPSNTEPGTAKHIAAYLLHPDHFGLDEQSPAPAFETIAFDEPPPKYNHQFSGSFLPSSSTPTEFSSLLDNAYKEVFPTGDIIKDMKNCESMADYDRVLHKHQQSIDTFNYGINGLRGDADNILNLPQFAQPFRIGLSCTNEPQRYFPSVGVFCQLLQTYGAAGRPMADVRSRPMGPHCFRLGVEYWKHSRSQLDPISRECPPDNCQVLVYPDLHLTDEEGILERNKKKRKRRNNSTEATGSEGSTIKSNDDNTHTQRLQHTTIKDDGLVQYSIQTRANSKRSQSDATTTILGDESTPPKKKQTKKSQSTKKKHYISEMRPHHDNGVRDVDTRSHVGANPDKAVNSHIYGSSVLMVTYGPDTMDYHLIRPSYQYDSDIEKVQDYRMSQKEAIKNKRKNKKNPSLKLVKTVPLGKGSIYVHTAHDDEMYFHTLDYADQLAKQNRVRLVFVYRWLAVSAYFRQNSNDQIGNRYSMISKHAFEKLEQRKHDKDSWWKALNYIDGYGNNIIKPLMDPF